MDTRRRKVKRQQDETETVSKDEYAVAKFLRFNLQLREGKLRGMPVVSFTGEKAVDLLMDSKWATNKIRVQTLFSTRSTCVEYCQNLLLKGLFHRATKLEKKKEKNIRKGETKEDEEKKKKKKLRLEMHDQQLFIDGEEIYVWIYDPTPFKNKVIGLFLVLGAVCVCLFPLWPPEVRLGVYYVSLAAAAFVAFILVLCVVRHVIFSLIWAVTFGNHHLWILPNLTEDVGFMESFQPLYTFQSHSKITPKVEAVDNTCLAKEKYETTTEQHCGDNNISEDMDVKAEPDCLFETDNR